jgi:hypothetical protein
MRVKISLVLSICAALAQFSPSHARADDLGVHCQIDGISFDADPALTHADYMIPPSGKPRFRILAGHPIEGGGNMSIELKAHGVMAVGAAPLSQESSWKSVLKMPKQKDSAITSGDFTFTHFDPKGDVMAAGTVQFQTADAQHGECHFRIRMDVVDLGNFLH